MYLYKKASVLLFFILSMSINFFLILKLKRSNKINEKLNPTNSGKLDKPLSAEDQYLSHVVVPFHWKEIEKIVQLISKWETVRPCTGYEKNRPMLLFYSSDDTRREDRISEAEDKLNLALSKLSLDVLRCFEGIEIKYANLTNRHDVYFEVKRQMLEKLIKGKIESNKKFRYIFYMDAETIPIREGWIGALNRSVEYPNEGFWMKGSAYRGSDKNRILAKEAAVQKINGHAIYNINPDDGFKSFFERILKPYTLQSPLSNRNNFDSDVYNFLHDFHQIKKTRKIIHKFLYSEIVQDHSNSSYKTKEVLEKFQWTFFVYGGIGR
eukprot:GHVP01016002.1.p1 GENE.GHVP01016002.1~~GHVP01016002.1.p1  ORF type:complete len:323 (+),score=43.38 GHVP01016002.1:262-1230(+)